MDAVLRVGEASVAQLAVGVADKLRDAVRRDGDMMIPTYTDGKSLLGQEFRLLAEAAALNPREMAVLMGWLEGAYNAEVAARFQLDLPTFKLSSAALQATPAAGAGSPPQAPGAREWPSTPRDAQRLVSRGWLGASRAYASTISSR